jgi:hypothetical protein
MSALGGFRNEWARAEATQNEYITPDDGKHSVLIEKVEYTEKDKDGNFTYPTFIYTFRILGGNQRDGRFRRFTVLRNEQSMGFCKGDMITLGLPIPQDPEELPNVFSGAAGIVAEVTVKTKNINGRDFKDIYINRRTGKQAEQPPAQYPQPQQFTDARAQPPQGYYAQPPQYQQEQPQAFGAGYNQNEEIPF